MSTVYVCDICLKKSHEPPDKFYIRGTYEGVEFTSTFLVTPCPPAVNDGNEEDNHVCHDCVLQAVRHGEFWDVSSNRLQPIHGPKIRSAARQSAEVF